MFTYEVKIYEKSLTSTVNVNSLAETYKIDESLDSALLTIPLSTRRTTFNRFSPVKVTGIITMFINSWEISTEAYWTEQNALGNAGAGVSLPPASGLLAGYAYRYTTSLDPLIYTYHRVYDDVDTEDTLYTHWWVLYTPKVVSSVMGTTTYYEHTLGLIEVTKWFDKLITGSLTFTQPLGGSQYTMKDVVERIMNLTPFVKYSSVASTRVFALDSTLATTLDLITAPQFYLDKKTLREALIEVLRYVRAIPHWTYNGTAWVLDADFINNRNIQFAVENELDYQSEASGEYFGQKAEVFHENTIPSEGEDSPNVYASSITDSISFRNDNIIVGESDLKLILTQDIYKLINFTALVENGSIITEVSLLDYIYEKKVFDTLQLVSGQGTQSYSVYWTYGSNQIVGFSETFNLFGTTKVIDSIISEFSTSTSYEDIVFRVEYIPFVKTMRSEQYREDYVGEFDTITGMGSEYSAFIVNPQERINSLYELTSNVYGQIQRLGLDTVSVSYRYTDLYAYDGTNDGIYSLGDYTDDGYFITKKEIVYYNGFVVVRYELSKNFNRIAQFVQVNKEFRPYEITLTKTDYTLKRDILMPFMYINISSSYNESHVTGNIINRFIETLKTGTYSGLVTSATMQIGSASDTFNANGVYLPVITTAEKNVLKFKLDFTDTKLAGKSVYVDYVYSGVLVTTTQKQVIYTETDGTIDYAQIDLYNALWTYVNSGIRHADGTLLGAQATLRLLANNYPYFNEQQNVVLEVGYNSVGKDTFITYLPPANIYANLASFPVTGTTDENYYAQDTKKLYFYSGSYQLYGNVIALKNSVVYELPVYKLDKDRSEILGLEMEIPILPNSTEINTFIIGDMLSKDNVLIKERSTTKQLYWYASSTQYTKANTNNIGLTSTSAISTVDNSDFTSNSIYVPSDVYAYNNYCIADASGNMYLAVNQYNFNAEKTVITRIYFNALLERE